MNEALLERLKASPQLPTLPAIAIRALELARKENVNLSEIADLISNDPALSSKILKTVNSSFYGLPKQVSTISHALVILGLQAVKTLALGFSLLTNLKTGDSQAAFDATTFWKRSIYTGVAGRTLAKQLNMVQQEEAFLAGLLGRIGTLVMHKVLGTEFDGVYSKAAGDREQLRNLCRQTFDLDCEMVGGAIAEHWGLPPVLSHPIAHHFDSNESDASLKPLVQVIHAAMIIGDVFADPEPAKYILRARVVLSDLGLAPNVTESLLAEIGSSTREAAKLFELNIGQNRSYQEILDEAQQALVLLTLQTQQQVQTIKKENETLQVKATTDPLTGLANRQRFNEFFDEQFSRAFKLQRPLAVLFIDADHFKKVNDTYGHQAGDEVLRRIGRLLKTAIRNIDLAARYGGEEFAVVLTETDTNAAATLADQIRQAIKNEKIVFEGKTIPISASIGVAGTDRLRIFQNAAQLTNAADRAVYAAKSAGRNCVRVFRPRIATAPASAAPAAPR